MVDMTDEDFIEFPKMARLARPVIVTEKIDGTNACVFISEDLQTMRAGSRTRWITPTDDHFGFAKWVEQNRDELLKLGPGRHYGEWWGQGIQRNYGLTEKRFSLFNTYRWSDSATRPACCGVVPVLGAGIFSTALVEACLERLRVEGSSAAPGFMKPEGVIAWHTAGNFGLKRTIEKDEEPKGKPR